MEPENSLSSSQESTTGPYPAPDKSSPHFSFLISLRSSLILSSHSGLGLPTVRALPLVREIKFNIHTKQEVRFFLYFNLLSI
jgi:hypothetical protein